MGARPCVVGFQLSGARTHQCTHVRAAGRLAAACSADSTARGARRLERFVSGQGGGVDAFVAEYVKLRTTFHERDLKRQAAEQTLG